MQESTPCSYHSFYTDGRKDYCENCRPDGSQEIVSSNQLICCECGVKSEEEAFGQFDFDEGKVIVKKRGKRYYGALMPHER